MPRHASRRRARCRARLPVKCRLAHAHAACACPGRHENARARGKAAGLFLTASRSRVTAARVRNFFPFCQTCLHARLHPLATERQTSPRRVQRSARGIGVPRLSPVTLPHAWQNVGTSVSTAIGVELTLDYSPDKQVDAKNLQQTIKCFCGTQECKGYLY